MPIEVNGSACVAVKEGIGYDEWMPMETMDPMCRCLRSIRRKKTIRVSDQVKNSGLGPMKKKNTRIRESAPDRQGKEDRESIPVCEEKEHRESVPVYEEEDRYEEEVNE